MTEMKQKIMQSTTKIINRIRLDLQNNWIGMLAVCLYFLLLLLIFHEVCPMLILTGLPCPACGLTRAGVLLLRGDFAGAFQMHPFIYVWILSAVWFGYNRYVRGRKTPYGEQLFVVLILAMLVYYIYRMVRYFPDVEPMIWSKHRSIWNFRRKTVS